MKILIYFTLFSLLFSSPVQKAFEAGKKLYESQDFENSKNIFLSLPQSPESFHNVANTLYHLGDFSGALGYYEDSLSLGENELTKNNYEYVKNLLKEKENTQQEQEEQGQDTQQSEQNQDSGTGAQGAQSQQAQQDQGESQQENSTDPTGPSSADTLSNQRDEQYKLGEDKKVNVLSDSEKQQLEDYIERLQKQEQQQRDSFGKLGESIQGDFSDSLFDQFFGDSIFSNDLGKTEKDW